MSMSILPFRPARETMMRTDDGAIWPLSRHCMSQPETIRARMAEDLHALLNAKGSVDTEDYLQLGWSRQQVDDHARHAARLLAGECT